MEQVHSEEAGRIESLRPSRRVTPPVAGGRDADLARSVLALQQSAGNRATSALIETLTPIQRHAGPSTIAASESPETPAGTLTERFKSFFGFGSASATAAAAAPAGAAAAAAPAAAPAGPTQDSRAKEVKPFLDASEEGKAAQDIMGKRKVTVDWLYAGSGSFFDGENGVHINKSENAPSAALVFVHEMNHAEYHHLGKTADISKLDRATYVKTMIDEEAEGTVKSIVAKIEMEGGLQVCLNASFVMEKEYAVAYKNAIDELVKKNPAASEQEKKNAGRQAGLKRVNEGFYDGTIVTSTTGESYANYYGKAWDKMNAPPAAAPPAAGVGAAPPVGVAGGF